MTDRESVRVLQSTLHAVAAHWQRMLQRKLSSAEREPEASEAQCRLITAPAKRSISSSCGLNCNSNKSTPAFSKAATRSAT